MTKILRPTNLTEWRSLAVRALCCCWLGRGLRRRLGVARFVCFFSGFSVFRGFWTLILTGESKTRGNKKVDRFYHKCIFFMWKRHHYHMVPGENLLRNEMTWGRHGADLFTQEVCTNASTMWPGAGSARLSPRDIKYSAAGIRHRCSHPAQNLTKEQNSTVFLTTLKISPECN